jgi:hypothetical protein
MSQTKVNVGMIDATSIADTKLLQGDGAWITPAAGGKILQVVNAHITTTEAYSGTWAESIITANITPSATGSTILVMCQMCFGAQDYSFVRLKRDTTIIGVGTSVGARNAASTAGIHPLGTGLYTARQVGINWVDSPSTTSQVTYVIEVGNSYNGNASRLNGGQTDTSAAYTGRSVSTMILMEISS